MVRDSSSLSPLGALPDSHLGLHSHHGQLSPAQPQGTHPGLSYWTQTALHPYNPGNNYSQRSAQPRPRASRTLMVSRQQAEASWREIADS